MLSAAIVVCGLCVPGSVLLWRMGGIWKQAEFLAYRRECHAEQAAATAKQAHEIQAALTGRIEELSKFIADTNSRVARLEQGRVLLERKSA